MQCNDLICQLIQDYYSDEFSNVLESDRSFDAPIVGFSSGLDPLYEFIKKDIGEFYWTPFEAFSKVHDNVLKDKLNVVSFVFPQTTMTKKANASNTTLTSLEWATHRLKGEDFLDKLTQYLVNELKVQGIRAMSPTLNDNWSDSISDKYGYASSWSHRHTAYISGLGTFSLSDGLITSVGKAHRCGSIIVECDIEVTKRNYNSYLEYCLYYKDGSCQMCVHRCPANAITKEGHDKLKCRAYQKEVQKPHNKEKFDLVSACCGLCQVGVPCESRIP